MTIAIELDEKKMLILESFRKALELAKLYSECGSHEYSGLLNGLDGGYVEPGASGALPRGKIEVLPTGRNFYAVDPMSIPTRAAWEIGVESAKRMLRKIVAELGRYPESVGEVLWSIDAYKADGEQLARILYLLGVRPVWDSSGRVVGVEPIPLEELGRPRIDVVVRISGIVRDTLPNYIYLISEAVEKVIALDEPLDMNYPKKHYEEFLAKLVEQGMSREEASEIAMARVWGDPPGAYGAGVNYAVFASAWRSDEDLAKVWIQWGSHLYTKKRFGIANPKLFVLQLSKVDAVARNHPSDEHDPTNCCCYFAYQGGFHTAVKVVKGSDPLNLIIDTRDPINPDVRSIKEELERVVYSKLLNPRWIEEMKKHGYRGASEFMKKILHLYGWQATTRALPNEVWDRIAEKYVLDEEMRRWFMENNPYALEEISRRLLEAAARGLWKPSEEIKEKLYSVRMEIESLLEGEVQGVAQRGEVWIYSYEDVDSWREKMKSVDEAVEWVKSFGSR